MNRPLSFFVSLGMALATGAASASYPPPVRVYRRPVVVVQPPPPPVVYVEEAPRTVVVERPAPRRTQRGLLGVGFRFNTMALEGTKLYVVDIENSAMPGFGIQLRSMVSEHWGLELSVDYVQTADGDNYFAQHTVPVMLSPIFYLFPDSPINPYALVGVGVHFTTLDYYEGLFQHTLFEVAGQAGIGVQVKLGDHFAINADARFLTVFKNIGSGTEVSSQCLRSEAGRTGFCDGLQNLDAEDKFNFGAQFQVGATYYF